MTTVAAAQSGFELTPQGLAYCLAHGREATERRIERHLAIVTALLALIDSADPDPDLEPSLAGFNADNDDREGDDVLDTGEPSLGWAEMEARYGRYGESSDEREVDNADDEPILGSVNPSSGTYVETLGFWKVKPYWMSDAAWQRDLNDRHSTVFPTSTQTNWSTGRNDDHEDEHDGAEPENEHGTDLDAGEDDGIWVGELDEAESDDGGHIPGGGYHV